jgi:hypothetical protein
VSVVQSERGQSEYGTRHQKRDHRHIKRVLARPFPVQAIPGRFVHSQRSERDGQRVGDAERKDSRDSQMELLMLFFASRDIAHQ